MKKKLRILSVIFLLVLIFSNINLSYAYQNNAFKVNVPNKYMGKDVISNSRYYGLGERGNFLFITEEDSSKDKIKILKNYIIEEIISRVELYGKEKLLYNLQVIKINEATAFTYEPDNEEALYYIPTDNHMISIQILSNNETSPYNNSGFMKVINSIEITDSVNTINYNKSTLTVINWNFALKYILPIVICIVIVLGIIIFIKRKK